MHPHLSRNMTQNYMAIFQFDPEGCIGEIFQDLPLHLDVIFLRHNLLERNPRALEVSLLQKAFVLVGHDVGLNLRHEVHRHHHDDQQ